MQIYFVGAQVYPQRICRPMFGELYFVFFCGSWFDRAYVIQTTAGGISSEFTVEWVGLCCAPRLPVSPPLCNFDPNAMKTRKKKRRWNERAFCFIIFGEILFPRIISHDEGHANEFWTSALLFAARRPSTVVSSLLFFSPNSRKLCRD